MADGVVYTGFDPEFGDRLNRLLALAKAEGYTPDLISGRRDAYGWPGMKGQSQAELYNQLGKPGGPRAAAPPGYSPHQYGVAGDVTGIPQSELERLSSEVGLRTIHSDPNHVELPSWRQEAATQPPPTSWSETNPANVPSRYASNVSASAVPGKTINSISTDRTQTTPAQRADWYRNYIETTYPGKDPNLGLGIAKAEGLNAPGIGPSRVDVDPQTGQPFSFGDFQYNMHPGALGSQVLAAGLDPRDPNLWQQTGKWALDQIYAKNNVAPWKGDPVAAAYLKTGAAPPSMPPGAAPVSSGRPGIGSDAVAGGTAGEKAPATWQDWAKTLAAPGAGGKASPLESLTKGLADATGGGDQGGQQGGQQAQQLQAQQAAAAYGAQRQQALTANASQLMAQILAQGKKPLSWGSASPGGAKPGTGAGQLPPPPPLAQSMPDEMLAQLMQQGGSMGTSLNSMGDQYG